MRFGVSMRTGGANALPQQYGRIVAGIRIRAVPELQEPSVARSPEAIAHLRVARTQRDATVGILRVNHERRMVDLTGIEPVTS